MQHALKLIVGLALTVVMTVANAHGFIENGIYIGHPWARPTPPVQPINAAVYLTIENQADTDIRLTAATTSLGQDVSIHQSQEVDGMMTMKPVEQGVSVGAGDVVSFEPGGYHIMMKGLEKPLEKGGSFPLALTFDNGQRMDVMVKINNEDVMEESSHDHH